jgi:metal-sulfur cluster biosynthetic enzyme
MSKVFDFEKIKAMIINHISKVYDPEIPANIYDLGLIYEIRLKEKENYLLPCG